MISVTARQRRALTVRRHHLAGDATTAEQVARSVLALHATDPGSVVLSVLARASDITIPEILAAMYEERSLVRWMAMRRTLFVFPRESVPMIQAAVSRPLGATLRRQLISRITRNGTVPPIDGDINGWLTDVEDGVERALEERRTATGAQLGADEPRLRTQIVARAASDVAANVTSPLLVVMGTEGRLVRGTPTGTWTTRQHRWEPIDRWWPDGLPEQDTVTAQVELARAWLLAYGPATEEDLAWWAGWTKTVTRAALRALPLVDVDLDGVPGVMLDDPSSHAALDAPRPEPVATLLPALDPTAMGWTGRDWFLGIDRAEVFDRNSNIGPTLWWDGEVVGGWAIARTGEVRTAVLADRGQEAADAVERAAAVLQDRLDGVVVTPAFPTQLARRLSA